MHPSHPETSVKTSPANLRISLIRKIPRFSADC
jgi:hypothetical protein